MTRWIAAFATVILAGCSAAGSTPTPTLGSQLADAAFASADARANDGIYISGSGFVHAYRGVDRENAPPVCSIYSSPGEDIIDIGVDRQGDLIASSNAFGFVQVFSGPTLCGRRAYTDVDNGFPADAAALDAIHGAVVVASENGEFDSASGKFVGQVEICAPRGDECGNLTESRPGLAASESVAISQTGDCWSAGVDNGSKNALYYFKGCQSPGVPAKRWLNNEWGGLDTDSHGNLLSLDQGTASLYVYHGCDPICRKVGGPFALHAAAAYGHLNLRGTLFAAASSGAVDLYTYTPHALTYKYSITNGADGISGVAFSPGS
jgi:hypothetical protein